MLNAVTGTALRLAPPLLVTDDEIAEAVAILASVLVDAPRDLAVAPTGGSGW